MSPLDLQARAGEGFDSLFVGGGVTPTLSALHRQQDQVTQQYATLNISKKVAEVNISPKISISAQPLKMALHRNPAVHGTRMVIFLHDSKKAPF